MISRSKFETFPGRTYGGLPQGAPGGYPDEMKMIHR